MPHPRSETAAVSSRPPGNPIQPSALPPAPAMPVPPTGAKQTTTKRPRPRPFKPKSQQQQQQQHSDASELTAIFDRDALRAPVAPTAPALTAPSSKPQQPTQPGLLPPPGAAAPNMGAFDMDDANRGSSAAPARPAPSAPNVQPARPASQVQPLSDPSIDLSGQ